MPADNNTARADIDALNGMCKKLAEMAETIPARREQATSIIAGQFLSVKNKLDTARNALTQASEELEEIAIDEWAKSAGCTTLLDEISEALPYARDAHAACYAKAAAAFDELTRRINQGRTL